MSMDDVGDVAIPCAATARRELSSHATRPTNVNASASRKRDIDGIKLKVVNLTSRSTPSESKPCARTLAMRHERGRTLGSDTSPHFAMELHVQFAAAYPRESWVEHLEWLEPFFNERIEIRDGRMLIPTRAGLGLMLSEQVKGRTREEVEFQLRPQHSARTAQAGTFVTVFTNVH
jgi:hypothetical protein